MFSELRHLITYLSQRLARLVPDSSSSRTLQITSILGLAAFLFGLRYLYTSKRGKRDRRAQNSHCRASRESHSSCSAPSLNSQRQPTFNKDIDGATVTEEGLSWAVQSLLSGVKTISISAPGVLLEQQEPAQLMEAATLRDGVGELLREICKSSSVYIITQVEDDTGEATCRGALEASNLVGPKTGQILPHHLLFCSTLEGKVSIVRQLEPQLHIDAQAATVYDLKRFIRLVFITEQEDTLGLGGWQNIRTAKSLFHFFLR